MVLPELDVKYIQKWCALKEHSRHGALSHFEAQTTNIHVTVVRVDIIPTETTEITRMKRFVARFRYTKTTGKWTLYWPDNTEKFHRYKSIPGSKIIRPLLEAVDHNTESLFTW